MRVTADDLRALDACEDQVSLFAREWPDGVTVTAATLERAEAIGLDVWWWGAAMYDGQPDWDALDARYRQEIGETYARYQQKQSSALAPSPEWDAIDARHRQERDALILHLQLEGTR